MKSAISRIRRDIYIYVFLRVCVCVCVGVGVYACMVRVEDIFLDRIGSMKGELKCYANFG